MVGLEESDRLARARCLGCKYSLRGLPEGTARCPECGRPFDPANRRTYDDGLGEIQWVRWARPPGLIHSILVSLICAQWLREQTFPFGGFLPCTQYLLVPFIAFYVFRAAISFGVWLDGIPPIRRRNRASWFVTPVLLAILIASVSTHLPFRVRFNYGREALEAEAKRLLALSPTTSQQTGRPGWADYYPNKKVGSYFLGLVTVDYIRQHVYFNIGPGIRPHGLVYTGGSSEPPEEDHWRVAYLPSDWGLFASP